MFSDPSIEKIAAWVAVIQFLYVCISHAPSAIKKLSSTVKIDSPQNPLSKILKMAYNMISSPSFWGTIMFFFLGWLFYSLSWVLIAVALNLNATNVLRGTVNSVFIGLSTAILIGEKITKSPNVGRFIGGGLPLGGLALYYASTTSDNLQLQVPAYTWFAVPLIFGGILGVTIGTLVAHTMTFFKIYTPLANTGLEK